METTNSQDYLSGIFQVFFFFKNHFLNMGFFPQALMKAHDDVAQENYGIVDPKSLTLPAPPPPVFGAAAEEYRFVTIRKQGKEPLVSKKIQLS